MKDANIQTRVKTSIRIPAMYHVAKSLATKILGPFLGKFCWKQLKWIFEGHLTAKTHFCSSLCTLENESTLKNWQDWLLGSFDSKYFYLYLKNNSTNYRIKIYPNFTVRNNFYYNWNIKLEFLKHFRILSTFSYFKREKVRNLGLEKWSLGPCLLTQIIVPVKRFQTDGLSHFVMIALHLYRKFIISSNSASARKFPEDALLSFYI